MPCDRGNIQLRSYSNLEALNQIRPQWEELLSSYPLATTFSTWEWLSSWWRAFGGDQNLLVLGAFGADSRLCGLLPLSIARLRAARYLPLKVLRLMGDGSGDSDNLDLPVRPSCEEHVASIFLQYLDENKSLWDICELNTLPSDSPVGKALAKQLRQEDWRVVQRERVASAIPLPAAYGEYLKQLSSEDQKNLARYSRRLEKRYATRIYRCATEPEVSNALEAMFRLHQARWQAVGECGSFASPERRQFYFDLSRLLLDRRLLELWVLELDGTIAAVQYAFRYGTTVFQLQEGFDSSRSSDRVGFILRGKVLEALIAEGVRKYDFLAGQPGYKARWSVQVGHYDDLHFARPFSLGSTYLQAVNGGQEGKKWLRTHLPQSAWAALHRANLRVRGRPANQSATPDSTD